MKIIYPQTDGTIAITFELEGWDMNELALMTTPHNTPFLIVQDSELPSDWSTSASWEADFSNPDGVGLGAQRYFIAKAAEVINNPDSTPEQIEEAMRLSEQMQDEILALEGAPL